MKFHSVFVSFCCNHVFRSHFLSIALVVITWQGSHASPADPSPGKLSQPDGSSFLARLVGDEHFGYYQTEDGYPVVRDQETDWWCYAGEKEEGLGGPVGGKVGLAPRPARRWTPRVPGEELELRQTRYLDSASVPTALKNGPSDSRTRTKSGRGEVLNANVAMLLTTFSDTAGLTHLPSARFQKEYFDTDPSSYSARELFRQMSGGKHLLGSGPEGIDDWKAAPNNRIYYGDARPYAPNTTRENSDVIRELVRWRVEAVEASFDWGKYDVDNDGWVDVVCLVFKGGSQTQAGGQVEDLWPIRFSLDANPLSSRGVWNTGDLNADGEPVFVRDFILVPERGSDGDIKAVGTFCHEYGHAIGWPDLYDTDSSSEGVGRYCLMGTGGFNSSPGGRSGDRPPWANPWCRSACGWITPENLTANVQSRTLRPVNEENVALRLWRAGTSGKEYYLAENRKKTGFDIGLPDEGLFIWHVNEDQTDNKNEWWSIPGVGGETTLGGYAVALEQADGLFEMERDLNSGGVGDAFRDGATFDSNSVPSAKSLSGASTAVAVRNISINSSSDVTADFFVRADFVFPLIGNYTPNSSGGPVYVVNQLGGQASDNVEVSRVDVAFRRRNVGAEDEWYNWQTREWDALGREYDPGLSHLYEMQATLGPPLGGSGDLRNWNVAIDPNDVGPGSYSIEGRATDSSDARSQWTYSYFEVGENPNAPDVLFDEPSVWENYTGTLPGFSGTAVNVTAPFRVDVALQAVGGANDGDFYNWLTKGLGGGFTNQHITSDISSPWLIDMSATTLPEGTYILYSRVENNDQVISGWRSRRFRVGKPAEVRITRPAHNATVRSLNDIGGTIVEPSGTGVQNGVVLLTLKNALGEYWDGGAWIDQEAALTGQISGSHWSLAAVPPVGELANGPFEIVATMTTNTGEMPSAVPGVSQTTFSIDNAPPSVTISGPVHESVITTSPLPLFTGTASDPGGIGSVNCFIRRNSDGAFWTGYTWTYDLHAGPREDGLQGAPPVAFLEGSYSGGRWSCNAPLPLPRIHMENGSYNFIVIVADRAGNHVQVDSAITLNYHQVFQWTGNGLTNNWADATNWLPYGVPGPEDYAEIGNGGTVFSSIDRTVRGMRIVNGTVSMNGNALTTTHDSFWQRGWLRGIILDVEPGSIWEIKGDETKTVGDGSVINNRGLIDWQGPGPIRGQEQTAGWTLNNQDGSVFRISSGGTIFSTWYGNVKPTFNNESGARIELATDGSLATWNRMNLVNQSDLFLQGGTLSITNNGVDFNPGSALAGFATLVLNTRVNINTRVFSSAAVGVTGGSFRGAGGEPAVWAGPGVFTWHAGDLHGKLTFEAGTTSLLAGTGQKQLRDGAELINEGEMRWSGAGNIRAQSQSELSTIRNRGTFVANTSADLTEWYANERPVFINESGATFRKEDPGTTRCFWKFDNAGNLVITEGSLALYDGGSQDGPIEIQEDGLLFYALGSFPHADGVSYSGSGRMINDATIGAAGAINNDLVAPGGIEQRNGWLGLNLTMDGPGKWEWTGGYIWGKVTLPAESVLSIRDGSPSVLKECADDTVFENHGKVIFSGPALRARTQSGTPFQFYNKSGGVFEILTDGNLMTRRYANSTPIFHNESGARLVKSGESGVSRWNGYHLENESEIAIESGAFAFTDNTVNLNPGTFVTGTGTLDFNTRLYLKSRVATTAAIEVSGGFWSSGGEEPAVWAGPGLISWSGGDLYGAITLASGTETRILGADQKQLRDNAELINEGELVWTGSGNIRAQSQSATSTIRNRGIFVADTGADLTEWYANVRPRFINEAGATFRKEGEGNLRCHWGFDSESSVVVNGGTVDLRDGGRHDGTIEVREEALVAYSAGSFELADGILLTGGGHVTNDATIAAAGLIDNQLSATGSFEHRDGWFGSNATLGGPGEWLWTGGTIGGALTVPTGSSLRLPDSVEDRYCADECVLDIFGLVTWEGGTSFRSQTQSGNPFKINNHADGVFRITADGNLFSRHYSNTKPVFENASGARIERTGGSGFNRWNAFHLNNRGEIAVDVGRLSFSANRVNLYDGSTVTGSGGLEFDTSLYLLGRVHSMAAIDLIGGFWAGLEPGLEVEPAVWAGPGLISWKDGEQYGTITLEAGTTSRLLSSGEKFFRDGSELVNEGNMIWSGGRCRAQTQSGPPAIIRNRGQFIAASPESMTVRYGNSTARFINEGRLELGGQMTMSGWAFEQAATGSTAFDIGGSTAGSGFDRIFSTKTSAIDGVLLARTAPGYHPPAETVFNVLEANRVNGTFATVEGSYTESYEPGQVNLTADGDEGAYDEFLEEYFPGETDLAIVGKTADPDGDGINNLGEFAFGGNPGDRKDAGQIAFSLVDCNGNGKKELVLTLAVRAGTIFSTDLQPAGNYGTLEYSIHGLDRQRLLDSTVISVPALPTTITGLVGHLPANYVYHSFALDGSDGLPDAGLVWARVRFPDAE